MAKRLSVHPHRHPRWASAPISQAFDSARQLARLLEVTHGISDFPGPELDDADGRERRNPVLGQLGHPSRRLGRQRLLDRPHRFACCGEITRRPACHSFV